MSTSSAEWRTTLDELAAAPMGSLDWGVAGDLSVMDDKEALDYLLTMYWDDPPATPEFAEAQHARDVAVRLLHLLFVPAVTL